MKGDAASRAYFPPSPENQVTALLPSILDPISASIQPFPADRNHPSASRFSPPLSASRVRLQRQPAPFNGQSVSQSTSATFFNESILACSAIRADESRYSTTFRQRRRLHTPHFLLRVAVPTLLSSQLFLNLHRSPLMHFRGLPLSSTNISRHATQRPWRHRT